MESNKDYNIGYSEWSGFYDFSEYEELADYEEQPMMTQEEKQLLLQDLCARLPYGVKVNISASKKYDNYIPSINDATVITFDLRNERCNFKEFYWDKEVVNVRPYLRPMSSMTEEERLELSRLTDDKFKFYLYTTKPEIICYEKYNYLEGLKVLDWLNAHLLDHRGLIEKGLAIDCTDLNIY